ncbi:hypothetical protein FO440_05275 [Mucilaginibacter corticis]|uniref:DUF6438 domain-containing protein n=1 Tax=Mucilaginibacter corticis TaxID=2597670 RepID=A0A556MUI7_9SPHI|nr:DUF6438 domain-containing protein [Mucilaginibacter corticis]TSJ43604.1 hypothetical protein FO440_05275 [Mucilaginibacter corticis]
MRKTFLIIFAFLSYATISFSQNIQIDSSLWISEHLDGIRFYENRMATDWNGYLHTYSYQINKDTVFIGDPISKQHSGAKFLISDQDNKSFILSPADTIAKLMSHNNSYHFTNIKFLRDTAIRFTRIHLNTGECFGTCPVLSIDINNNGTYYLKGGQYAGRYQGYFKGRLNTKQLDTLNDLIQNSLIEKMQGWKQKVDVNDTPPYNLTLYYNNKKLIVQTNWPPMVIENLLKFLTSSYEKITLLPDKEKHEFNEDDGMKYH